MIFAAERFVDLLYDGYRFLCGASALSDSHEDEFLQVENNTFVSGKQGEAAEPSRIRDNDLDMEFGIGTQGSAALRSAEAAEYSDFSVTGGGGSLKPSNKSSSGICLTVLLTLGRIRPHAVCQKLSKLIHDDSFPEDRMDLIEGFCKIVQLSSMEHFRLLLDTLANLAMQLRQSEYLRGRALQCVTVLAKRLLGLEKNATKAESASQTLREIVEGLVDLVSEIVNMGLHFWKTRIELSAAVESLLRLDPALAQALVEPAFLPLLQDLEFRVRLSMAKRIEILFQIWDGHHDLLQDVIDSCGLKMIQSTRRRLVSLSQAESSNSMPVALQETTLAAMGCIAAVSEAVEESVVIMICAHAAQNEEIRSLAHGVLKHLAKRMNYSTLGLFLQHHIARFCVCWVESGASLQQFTTIGYFFEEEPDIEPELFVRQHADLLLPPLLLLGHDEEVEWLAQMCGQSVADLLKANFSSIFAALLPLHSTGVPEDGQRAMAVLQGSLLEKSGMSEEDRDALIRKRMVTIVSLLLKQTTSSDSHLFPNVPMKTTVTAVRTVIDGFLESQRDSEDGQLVDKLQVLRSDRVFALIMELHHHICNSRHPRHRKHSLAALGALLTVLDSRATVPSTFRYAVLILVQNLDEPQLQSQCCGMMIGLLRKMLEADSQENAAVLGNLLQQIMSKVTTQLEPEENHRLHPTKFGNEVHSPQLVDIVNMLTTDAPQSLRPFIKELDQLPDVPDLESARRLQDRIREDLNLSDELMLFSKRAPGLPSNVRQKSLQTVLERILRHKDQFLEDSHNKSMANSTVSSVWKIVEISNVQDDEAMRELAARLLSIVGVWDTDSVAFHLPQSETTARPECGILQSISTSVDEGLNETLVSKLLLQLATFLVDEDLHIIDLSARTLQGLLSTEEGHASLLSLNSVERRYLEILSKGVSSKRVQSILEVMIQGDSAPVLSLENPGLWTTKDELYENWICRVVHSLLPHCQSDVLRLCQSVAAKKPSISELLFPHVLGNLAAIWGRSGGYMNIISARIEEQVLGTRNFNKKATQLLLESMISLFRSHVSAKQLSGQSKPGSRESRTSGSKSAKTTSNTKREALDPMSPANWNKAYWLDVNYLVAAKAAERCGSLFTAVLYVELWCEERFGTLTLGEPDFSDNNAVSTHEQILLDIYSRINEPDGIYGVARTNKVTSRLSLEKHENRWDKALETYDLLSRLSSTSPLSASPLLTSAGCGMGVLQALQQMGCLQTSKMYRQGLLSQSGVQTMEDATFADLEYETAWRTGNWTLPDALIGSPNKSQKQMEAQSFTRFNQSLFSCMKSLSTGDSSGFAMELKQARQKIVKAVYHSSVEAMQLVNPAIVKLQILSAVEEAWKVKWPYFSLSQKSVEMPLGDFEQENSQLDNLPTNDEILQLESDWEKASALLRGDYDLLEPMVAAQGALLQIIGRSDRLTHHLCKVAAMARKAGKLTQASNAILELKQAISHSMNAAQSQEGGFQEEFSSAVLLRARVEEAKILWAQEKQEMAVKLIQHVSQELCVHPADKAYTRSMAGKWLAETRSMSSRVILEQYLEQAAELMQEEEQKGKVLEEEEGGFSVLVCKPWRHQSCNMYFRLAHYSDALYRSLLGRVSSPEWAASQSVQQHKMRELEAIRKRLKVTKLEDQRRALEMRASDLYKQINLDNEENARIESDKSSFLMKALHSYRMALTAGGKYDTRVVFRLVALWFEQLGDIEVNKVLMETIKQVPSFKFLPLVHQLASRMNATPQESEGLSFQDVLTTLVTKLAVDHPYHSLYQILALANGDRVRDKRMFRSAYVVDQEKKEAAMNVLSVVATTHKQMLVEMKQMIEMYITLAELETQKQTPGQKTRVAVQPKIPRDIRAVRNLELVPVITADLPVDPTCTYSRGSFPSFCGFVDKVTVMNGINAPKVVECLGSDGLLYKQLAKSGNDDLRQDAVMEQLFTLVNTLLRDHADTRKRRLHIRTYKVVPFTPSAGILEWVNGTIPLGDYLLGPTKDGGAHARYGAGQWSYARCREYMTKEPNKALAFQTVCHNFRPVMRHFFLERFSRPSDWFERRLAYTRSVAASCMVGYIVGLGDRHSMNILMDNETAEAVHIDLGIAFEQGLLLKTPERVPFRLTRDIVDAMGVCGVEGVFRRCCEATLAVLRSNKEALLTIVMVFLHDPLYKWALSPLKALRRQEDVTQRSVDDSEETGSDSIEGNQDAARALLRVKQKLDGYEEGDMLSLEGQVQQLIQNAQDPDRLSLMFPGWGAWL